MRRLSFLLCVLIWISLFFSPVALAAEHSLPGGVLINLSEEYTLLTNDNLKSHEKTITDLGHSLVSLRSYMEENHILFIAVDTENKNQVQLSAFKTDFSEDIGDLTGLRAEDLEAIGNKLINGHFETISIKGEVYFKAKVDGLVGYATVQYITVKNNKLYTLNYYGSNVSAANEIASGLTLPTNKAEKGTKSILLSVLLWALMVIALATTVLLILSILSDLRKKKENNDVREYIRIKRHWKF